MAEALELAGLIVGCGAAAAAVLGRGAPWQPAALAVALVAAPLVVAGDVWNEPRIAEARSSPATVIAASAVIVAAVGLAVALIRRFTAAFAVLVFAVLALRVPIEVGGEASNLLVPLYLTIVAGFIAGYGATGRSVAASEPAAVVWLRRALAATLVLYAAQATYSEDVSNAIENAGFFLIPFSVLFCQLAQARWDRQTLRAVAIAVGAVGASLAVIAVGQFLARELFFNDELFDSNQLKPVFRVNSLFFDPNVFARYMALGAIAIAAAVAFSRGGRAAVLGTAAGALMLLGLALSYSITGAAALLAGFAVLATLGYGLRGAAGAALAIGLTGIVFALSGGAERSDIGPARGIGEETSGRVDLVEGGWELIKAEPIVGWGSGAFGRAFFDEVRRTRSATSHSEPVTVAAEQGVPGLVVYAGLLAAMVATLFGAGVRSSAGRAATAAGVAAVIVHSLGYAAFLTDPATWALLGVAVGLRTGSPAAEPPGS